MVSPALRPSSPFPVLDVAPEVVAVPSVVDPCTSFTNLTIPSDTGRSFNGSRPNPVIGLMMQLRQQMTLRRKPRFQTQSGDGEYRETQPDYGASSCGLNNSIAMGPRHSV